MASGRGNYLANLMLYPGVILHGAYWAQQGEWVLLFTFGLRVGHVHNWHRFQERVAWRIDAVLH